MQKRLSARSSGFVEVLDRVEALIRETTVVRKIRRTTSEVEFDGGFDPNRRVTLSIKRIDNDFSRSRRFCPSQRLADLP